LASLLSVDVLATDGSHAQCFYHAVGTALGLASVASPVHPDPQRRHWPEIERRLRQAIDSIHDAATLQEYGFPCDAVDNEAALQIAKERHYSSADFVQQQWGGTLEMLLLSHESRGALAFDTYNSTSSLHWRRMRADGVMLGEEGDPLPVLPLARIIVLHACAYRGGATVNHFELLQFRLAGQSQLCQVWQHVEPEPPQQRDRRTLLIAAACDRARSRTQHEAQSEAHRHEAMAKAASKRDPPLLARSKLPWWRMMERGLPSLHPALQYATSNSAKTAALCGRGQATQVVVRVHEALSRAAYGKPLQFGLFATAAHASGALLTPYGGVVRHATDYKRQTKDDPLAIKSHSRRVPQSDDVLDGLPLACMYSRPLASDESVRRALGAGIGALEPSSADFAPQLLQLWQSSSFGFMANTSRAQLCNASIVYVPHPLEGPRGGVHLHVPWLQATKPIAADEEILCAYKSFDSKQLLMSAAFAPLHARGNTGKQPCTNCAQSRVDLCRMLNVMCDCAVLLCACVSPLSSSSCCACGPACRFAVVLHTSAAFSGDRNRSVLAMLLHSAKRQPHHCACHAVAELLHSTEGKPHQCHD